MLRLHWLGVVVAVFVGSAHARGEPVQTYSVAENACGSNEAWKWGVSIPEEIRESLISSFDSGANPYESFVQAQALKGRTRSVELLALSEYWVGRIYFQAGQLHLAHTHLTALASRKVEPTALGFQLAAMECLGKIKDLYPTLKISSSVAQQMSQLPILSFAGPQKEILRRMAFQYLKQEVSADSSDPIHVALAKFLEGSGPYEHFHKAFQFEKQNKANEAVMEFRKLLASDKRPVLVENSLDLIYLTYARALYAAGKYVEAADTFRKVPKNSNYLGQSLSDLAWAFLLAGKYKDAIGASYNLQRSNLREIFLPEGPMVMSIALNEMCQFQRAIQSVRYFRKRFRDDYAWLKSWNAKPDVSLYTLLVSHLQGAKGVPGEIATEWLRSPVFLAHQEEINLLKDEKSATSRLLKLAFKDTRTARAEGAQLTQVIASYKGKKLNAAAKKKLSAHQIRLASVQKRGAAAALWDKNLRTFHQSISSRDAEAVSKINADLSHRNRKMISQLRKVDENTEFVEIEIYDGASEDMVWRNAHPDFKEISKKFKEEQQRKSKQAVWKWGSVPEGDETGEVWEDELGWYSEDLQDECSNKNRYLSIKAAD